MSKNKIVAVDFDGTLFENAWPNIGEPIWLNITKAKLARRDGAYLILWTCRTGEKLEEAVEACRGLGLEFDAVNENCPDTVALYGEGAKKVFANEYWDDLAVRRNAHTAKRESILRDAVWRFGAERQVDKAVEEMAELTQALLRVRQAMRYKRGSLAGALTDVLEEMADVQIMMDQMKLLFGDPSEVEDVKLDKLAHKIERYKEETQC